MSIKIGKEIKDHVHHYCPYSCPVLQCITRAYPYELNSQFSGNSWEFLGIPRNSQKFPIMQISSDLKSLELLGISGKRRLQFCKDLEFLRIPRNSQECSAIQTTYNLRRSNSWEFLGNEFENICCNLFCCFYSYKTFL